MTRLIINGKAVTVASEPDTPLLWVLRDELGLRGAKYGCGIAQCGVQPRIRAAIKAALKGRDGRMSA